MRYASFQKDCLKVAVAVHFRSFVMKLGIKRGMNGSRRNANEQNETRP